VGGFLFLLTAGIPEVAADTPEIIVDPEPGSGIEVKQIGPNQVQLRLSQERQLLRPQGTLGNVNLGDVSPLNPANFVWDEIRIRVRSNRSFFPAYRIVAMAMAPPDPTSGNLSTTDVGLGVLVQRACNPVINPLFDYDPRTVAKDIDGIPQFIGTVGSLPTGAPGAELFSSPCARNGRNNFFRLIMAVAPQFFTPTGSAAVDILVTLELI
jgi:hypothetical protein